MANSSIRKARASLIFVIDIMALATIFSTLYHVRLDRFPNYLNIDLWLIGGTFLFVLFLAGTYFRERSHTSPRLPIRTFFICIMAGITCMLWVYLLGPHQFNEYFGRGILPIGTIIFGILATINRHVVNSIYHWQESNASLLYLGYSKQAEYFLTELENHAEQRSFIFVTDKQISHPGVKVLSPEDNTVFTPDWQGIVIDPVHHSDKKEAKKLIDLRLTGTSVMTLADYYEKNWYMVPVDQIGDDWFLRSQGFSMLARPISLRIKRVIDLALALFLLILSSPLLLVCAILIKLTSRGPVMFKQVRVGQNGAHFRIYKLRTMHTDAEKAGAQWATENDPRITQIGAFLRKSRLDEIPQCWNVLKGEMSFVGPRPERPEFTKELEREIPYYNLRHLVKPGISGWAQVIFPYGASQEDALKKLQYELYYIKNQTLMLDLNIMVRTVLTIFQRSGR